jgi:hypothetical protein
MPTRLNIILDGTAPGLQEHALSVNAFGEPLARLVMALQRIASGLVIDAVGREAYGARGGRYRPEGRSIDVEIISVTGNSPLDLGLRVVERPIPGRNMPLFAEELTGRTVDRFLDAVDQESKGRPYNALVRRFLASMPSDVTSQRYVAETGRNVDVGPMELPEIPKPSPYLLEFTGAIVGVGFEPGRPEVKFKTSETTVTCVATAEQVEEVLVYRGASVRALAVRGPKNRLLAAWPIDQSLPVPSREQAEEYLFAKWGELLKRLAE